MQKKASFTRYTADEVKAMIVRGEDRTDWVRAGATTEADIEAQIAADGEEAETWVDWTAASVEMPRLPFHGNDR